MKMLCLKIGLLFNLFVVSSAIWACSLPLQDDVQQQSHPAVWKVIEKENKYTPPGVYKGHGSAVLICQASNKLFALSAAHCFTDPDHKWTNGALWYLTQYQGGQLSHIRINNVICHSQYSSEANDNDIALIRPAAKVA